LALSFNDQLEIAATRIVVDCLRDVLRGGDRSVVHLHDHIALLQTGLISDRRAHAIDQRALPVAKPAIVAERSLRNRQGALIYRVSPTIADQTGLQQGDVIVQVNNTPIATAQDVAKAIDYYAGRTYLQLVVERQGQLYMTRFGVR